MNLHIDSFLAGLMERIEFCKTANLFEGQHTTFFPMLQSQASWRYSRKDDKLHLHDGHHTYTFTVPKEIPDEDFPAERADASNHFEFENGADEKGTAQIHRADPGSIYLTLQDGRNNPTFTLQHQTGKSWKGVPKKRLKKILPEAPEPTVEVEPANLLEGAAKEAAAFWSRLEP